MNRFAAISEEMRHSNDYDIVAEFLRTMTPVPAHHFVGSIHNRTGTYFSPNPLSSVPHVVGQATVDVLVREYRTLWFEIDPASPPKNSGERAYVKRDQNVFIRRMIEGLGLPAPTFTVWSGNKSTHVFWRTNRPMTKIEWHSIQRGLIYAFNADPVNESVAEAVAGTVVNPAPWPCMESEAETAPLFARFPTPKPANHNCAAATLEKTCIPVDAPEKSSSADDTPTLPPAPVAEPEKRSAPADAPIGALYPVADEENESSPSNIAGDVKNPEESATG
jgi:hypothetical protein